MAVLVLGILAGRVPTADAVGVADPILEQVPPDAAMVLVVEDLRDHRAALADSGIAERFLKTRPAREWIDSDDGRKLRGALADIRASLGVEATEAIDGLLGEAVVLSLHLPDGADPAEARGLLRSNVRDRELLHRLIGVVNGAERASGALRDVARRRHRGVDYSLRVFNDGRPDEAYRLLDDGTFLWTNDERLLREVIELRDAGGGPSFAEVEGVARVLAALPERAIARVLVDPRFIARLAAEDPDAPGDELPEAILGALGAIEMLGAAIQWRDGPVLHIVEAIDLDRLPEPIRAWAARSGDLEMLRELVPASALLTIAGLVDFAALYDLAVSAVPEAARSRVDALTIAARGLLLDRDPRSAILPNLGPGFVGWVDAPAEGEGLRDASAILVISIEDETIAHAVDNALRTLFAFISLDENRAMNLRLNVNRRDATRVTALTVGDDLGSARVAYAIDRGLLVIGNGVSAVAAVLDAEGEAGSSRAAALRDRRRHFPDATAFAHLDLEGLRALADGRRDELIRLINGRRGADAAEDFDRLLDLLGLFRGAYATMSFDADASIARQRLGLIVDDSTHP